jgi:hypothetical protein
LSMSRMSLFSAFSTITSPYQTVHSSITKNQ